MTSAVQLYEQCKQHEQEQQQYVDRSMKQDVDKYKRLRNASATLYVGNLSFYTQEHQLLAFFEMAGLVKMLRMGLNRKKKTPCGFCFIEFFDRPSAELAKLVFDKGVIDDRIIRVDWDHGF